MRALALAAALAAPAAAAPGSVAFAVDPRVEALSVVLLLADPSGFKSRRPGGPDAYAAAAEAAFGEFAGHPAVARARALRADGAPASALARAALAPGDAFAAELRDFERASRFAEFFAARSADHAAYVETARREARRALSPAAALAYMGARFEGEQRFILAPLLPDDPGADALRLRPGIPEGSATRFGFDSFERSAASLLCREAASWLDAPAGGIPEHLAAAVGLRVLARDLGEPAYRAALRRHASPRLPRLEQLAEGLKGYESDRGRYRDLSSYSSRLAGAAALRVDQAEGAAREGRRGEALAHLARARGHGPDPETGRRVADLYLELDEDERARQALLRLPPRDARLELDLAARAARAGDKAAALRHLAAARPLSPSYEERRRMASLYRALDEPAPARELLDGLILAAPRDPGPRVELAALAARGGDGASARAALAQARALSPGPDDRRRMALIHQDLKDYETAAVMLAELAREQPENAALRADLGLCRYLEGRADEAIADLRAAIALDPAALPAVVTLGSIYAASRRFDLERALYDAAPADGGDPGLRALLRGRRAELARAARP